MQFSMAIATCAGKAAALGRYDDEQRQLAPRAWRSREIERRSQEVTARSRRDHGEIARAEKAWSSSWSCSVNASPLIRLMRPRHAWRRRGVLG